jgi:hypothetical protein
LESVSDQRTSFQVKKKVVKSFQSFSCSLRLSWLSLILRELAAQTAVLILVAKRLSGRPGNLEQMTASGRMRSVSGWKVHRS